MEIGEHPQQWLREGEDEGQDLPGVQAMDWPERVSRAGRHIIQALVGGYRGPVAVRLWNGERVLGEPDAPCTLVIRHPAALRDLVLSRNLVRLGEDYLSGTIDAIGNVETLFDLVQYIEGHKPSLGDGLRSAWHALHLPPNRFRGASRTLRAGQALHRNSQQSIAHHYDVSNDFYRLWLDPEMVYSCAYFRDAEQPLADAQHDKLDYLCRKLRLEAGQRLLDIGCGWGALACWAARHYRVEVLGITLSREQYDLARQRVRHEGLEDQVRIELCDYRDLAADDKFDRVVSVGMFEHVGIKNLPTYFGTVKRMLKPGGLFLNHGITNDTGWQRNSTTRFINRYVFPDAELTRVSHVSDIMERTGFEILDVESLRRHYALTLRRWVVALEACRDEAVKLTSEATYRLWRLYMSGCACYFTQGSSNVYQILAVQARQPSPVPLRRDDLYPDINAGQGPRQAAGAAPAEERYANHGDANPASPGP